MLAPFPFRYRLIRILFLLKVLGKNEKRRPQQALGRKHEPKLHKSPPLDRAFHIGQIP